MVVRIVVATEGTQGTLILYGTTLPMSALRILHVVLRARVAYGGIPRVATAPRGLA
jgi:hypothetical protein